MTDDDSNETQTASSSAVAAAAAGLPQISTSMAKYMDIFMDI